MTVPAAPHVPKDPLDELLDPNFRLKQILLPLSDSEFETAFDALVQAFANNTPQDKLRLAQMLFPRLGLRCRLVDKHRDFIRSAVHRVRVSDLIFGFLVNDIHLLTLYVNDRIAPDALHVRCESSDEIMAFVRALNDAGLDLDAPDAPRMATATSTVLLDAFLEIKGVEWVTQSLDVLGNTALHTACQHPRSIACQSLLLTLGLDHLARNKASHEPILFVNLADLNGAQDGLGGTPLQVCAVSDNGPGAVLLLRERTHPESLVEQALALAKQRGSGNFLGMFESMWAMDAINGVGALGGIRKLSPHSHS